MSGAARRGLRRRLAEFREDWAAAGEALERNRKRAARERVRADAVRREPADADAVAIANTATIAGNVANHVVNL